MKKSSLLLVPILASCVTVQEVQVPSGARTRFPELAAAGPERASTDEKKLARRRADGKLRVFLSAGAPVASRDRAAQELALLRLFKAIESPDIVYFTLNDPMRRPLEPMDARLSITFAEGEEDNQFKILLKTSEAGEGVTLGFEAKPSGGEGLRIVTGSKPAIAAPDPVLMVSTDGFKAAEIREMLESSIRGTLEVQSTSGETEIFLVDGSGALALGKVPVTGKKLDEGTYDVIARRKGNEERRFSVSIQAGQTRKLFIPWPDDPESTATVLLSSPPGMRIALNGQVRGTTPLYLVNENTDTVEFSRSLPEGGFESLAEVRPEGTDRSRIYFYKHVESFGAGMPEGDLWQTVQEKTSTAPLRGTRTRPFVVQRQALNLSLPVSDRDGIIALTTDQESIFIERMGNAFIVQRGRGLEPSGQAKAYQPIKERKERLLEFTYNDEKKVLEVELDGSTIFEGPFQAGASGRLFLLGQSELPATRLEIRTGRGVYDK